MTVVLLLVLVVPLWLAIDTIVEKADDIVTWVKTLPTFSVPSPPGWLESIPLFGSKLVEPLAAVGQHPLAGTSPPG